MPTIPDSIVDIIITSPPYNVNLGNNKHKKDAYAEYDDNMLYDDYLNWMDGLYEECYRVLKPGGRICINIGDGANGSVPTHADFTIRLRDKHKFLMLTTILWNKKQIGASTAWGSWKSPSQPSFPTPFEFIIVMAKDTLKHEGDPSKITVTNEEFISNSRALWEVKPETEMMKKYGHPAMYPEELVRRLLKQLTYEGDVVLD
ncbi:MAG: site-specific DNA-methyltransferase, partial [Methanomassiliicoccales archaeon]